MGEKVLDFHGNELNLGDEVTFMRKGYRDFSKAKIVKLGGFLELKGETISEWRGKGFRQHRLQVIKSPSKSSFSERLDNLESEAMEIIDRIDFDTSYLQGLDLYHTYPSGENYQISAIRKSSGVITIIVDDYLCISLEDLDVYNLCNIADELNFVYGNENNSSNLHVSA